MFTNERYLTREVAERVPIDIQLLMWDLVERIEEKDYLQIFELIPKGSEIVEIIHKQEIPEVTSIYEMENNEIKNKMKLYIIDNGQYSTMMFSHEY
ncbi:TPA: hypothetical protein KQW76_002753 [Clostridioides difficile]|nr:DUF960 family protein [Clostridioides difficile]EJA6689694.1 hypothetical protein [Clostridioides difficile]EQH51468.1 hypothetical protein QMG_3594 [Clostridioides difficile DA00256]MCA0587051.1 DUF960 domain-containing protein [Clostridioides difficile]MDO0484839.1 hypothetical protein [Clostridioides difficile]MDV9238818.1 DUF960 family protein [Clostridioides difficile]